jgi:hypothetical protein
MRPKPDIAFLVYAPLRQRRLQAHFDTSFALREYDLEQSGCATPCL